MIVLKELEVLIFLDDKLPAKTAKITSLKNLYAMLTDLHCIQCYKIISRYSEVFMNHLNFQAKILALTSYSRTFVCQSSITGVAISRRQIAFLLLLIWYSLI